MMFDCVVIGAGPGGIVATKELLENGLRSVVCLEQTPGVGGVFANDAYDSLIQTSSCAFSMFSDFWMGDGNQHRFWTKDEAIDYWERYAKHFGVWDTIRFGSKVVEVAPSPRHVDAAQRQEGGMSWTVRLSSGDALRTRRVALATGNNSIPRYPDWKDSLSADGGAVDVSHSQDYRNAGRFANRSVLVVGGGESASDIALEGSRVAGRTWVSLRDAAGFILPRRRGNRAADISTHRGLYGVPREYGAKLSRLLDRVERSYNDPIHDVAADLNRKVNAVNGVWGTCATKTFSLPEAIAHHGCQVVGEIIEVKDGGKTLIAAGGEVLNHVDAIVFCTGFRNYSSFVPDELKETDARSLYKHMFHPKYRESLVWIGWARPNIGSQFPIMEMQARLFALICTGERELPPSPAMVEAAAMDRDRFLGQFGRHATRVRSLVDYHRYMDDVADIIGCQPPLWKYFIFHPYLWLRMVYGAMLATQFRLHGPGKKEALAQEFLSKLPVSTFNHIVKAGIVARLYYLLKHGVEIFTKLSPWPRICDKSRSSSNHNSESKAIL